jgi:hypothetical protein
MVFLSILGSRRVKLMDVLPKGGQSGERKQKPECTDGTTQAVSGVTVDGFLNYDVPLVRSIEKLQRPASSLPVLEIAFLNATSGLRRTRM